jgi:antitoxin FitA
MASITIRNLDPDVKTRLRIRAAEHGRSMEAEAREILTERLGTMAAKPNEGPKPHLIDQIRAIVESVGGFDDLEIPLRQPARSPLDFSGPEWDR